MSKTPLSQGFIARAAAGLRYAFTGNGWFGAGETLPPVAPKDTAGRQFDYEPFFNTGHSRPRERDAIGFHELRTLADSYDVLRLVIEKRKDQMESLNWAIQHRDAAATGANESLTKDPRIDAAQAFFRQPDREHSWGAWLRILLEDLFVIDAPCIYPRRTVGGDLYALELMDGATVKRVLDDTGRTPLPPQTAYQQILRGLPAVDYAADELLYRPRNGRTYKVYGYSPVEQVVMTVNIALKRQIHALEYYRSGSVPDALVGVPESWSADDIRRFQEYWDLLLSGELAERRKMRFVPGELARNFHETKQPPLKDMYDEWLARVVCFAFSIEPTPFVAQVNRSVAETSREQSLADGLFPLKNWVKSLIDEVLAQYMDMADFEFVWQEEQALDPKQQAEIYAVYKNAGILTADEIRAEMGKEPLPDTGALPEYSGQPEQEAGKLGKSQRPISEDQAVGLIETYLLAKSAETAAQIAEIWNGAEFALMDAETAAAEIARRLSFASWADLADVVEPLLRQSAAEAAEQALLQLMPDPAVGMATNIRSRAVAWAAERAAEMVGMRRIAGMLLPNPDAEWQITEGTRRLIQAAVQEALAAGDSPQELAARLQENHAFSRSRAETIARTEMARADGAGMYIGWEESGLVSGKEWITAEDDKVSAPCRANGDAGAIGLHDYFPSGDLMPPAHPNCRCAVVPVLAADTINQP